MNDCKTINLIVEVILPEHYILTPDQPSQIKWELHTSGSVPDHQVQGGMDFREPKLQIELCISRVKTSADIKLRMYFCNESDMVCMLEQRSFHFNDLNSAVVDDTLTISVQVQAEAAA